MRIAFKYFKFEDFMIYSIKNNFILHLFFYLSLTIGFTTILEGSDFHLILITDLNAKRIELGMKKDLAKIQKVMRTIAKSTGLSLKEKIFVGKKTDPQEIFAYLRSLSVNADDVVLFYFSGHGFRTDQNPANLWPILAFEKAHVGIQFEEIATFLQKKQARLTLMFADCCNNFITTKKHAKPKDKILLKGVGKHLKQGYTKLFLKSHGTLIVASAKPGDYSYTNNLEGSLYTTALIMALKETIKLPLEQIKWSTIIESAKSKLAKVVLQSQVQQHPIENNAIIEN